MITRVSAGPYTVRGISVGGVYTTLHVPELGIGLDIGLALRSLGSVDRLFLSHGHADHAGSLATLLGLRALNKRAQMLHLYVPAEIADHIEELLTVVAKIQRFPPHVNIIPMAPGDEISLHSNLFVRAFRTYHPVPSLGYLFLRRVNKIKSEFSHLPGPEIATRRKAEEDLFYIEDHPELAYVTDTLARVFHHEPDILEARVLIAECTFLDERKSIAATHAGCHIHLDELIALASSFHNQNIVLMHFSQIYHPREIDKILHKRCPEDFYNRIVPFVPKGSEWPG